jgi:serine/threonine protein kinase
MRMVGDWQLQKTLGAGSMGKVKLATNVITKERVCLRLREAFCPVLTIFQCAVKIIPRYTDSHRKDPPASAEEAEKQRQKDESKEIRTVREAAISLLLHHPYVCGMREFISHTNHHYMVFECIDGGQMLDYIISHGRLRERAARKFARQIGSALDYCHKNSIVHRDLKIENILISKSGNIKIIDFGLSNLYAPDRHLSTFCGSLYFAAPELLNAKVYTGPEVDVWSFGIVLYVLVCGKVPFDDQSMPALHAKIKRGLVEYPAWLSNECKSLLARMLVTNPTDRATLTEVMAHPFMNKGYDTIAESHLIHREPLRSEELDWDVVNAMGGFTFGTPQQIHEELKAVLSSDAYKSTVAAWESRREKRRAPAASTSSMTLSEISDSPKKKRFSGFDLKKKLFKEEKKAEEPAPREKEPLDPTRGYDPLISIYFLAREKMERERVYGKGHFASSQASLDTQPIASGYGMALPNLPPPASTHAMGYDTPQSSSSQDYRPQARTRAEDIPNPVMQHPTADQETSQLADVPTAHRRGSTFVDGSSSLQPSALERDEDHGGKKFGFMGRGSRPSSSQRQQVAPEGFSHSPSMPIEHRRSVTLSDKKHERRVSVGSISSSMGRASLNRRASQSKPPTPPEATLSRHQEEDEANHREKPLPVQPDTPESVGAPLSGDVKSVYLKGLFSVSTTSSKPAATLMRDIDTVLERIGIKHRPIKGGFECVHIPSIDLSSVVNGDEATTSLPTGRQPSRSSISGLQSQPTKRPSIPGMESSTSRGPSPVRHTQGGSSGTFSNAELNGNGHGNGNGNSHSNGNANSNGATATPTKGKPEDDDVDAWALAQSGGAGSKLIVRFEIYVVKVSSGPYCGFISFLLKMAHADPRPGALAPPARYTI